MAEDNAIAAKPKQWMTATQDFWRDTTSEMKKVTWPGRQEVLSTTLVVIFATIIFAVYLWGCDQVFFFGTQWLFRQFGASV